VRAARARGLSGRTVLLRHALPAALLPVVSYLGPATAAVLAGSLVVETIFGLPGMGRHLVQGALNRDYTLVMGMVIVYACLMIVLNLLADLAYAWLDPRIRRGGGS
jgi:oligopeptide transport system permease protein